MFSGEAGPSHLACPQIANIKFANFRREAVNHSPSVGGSFTVFSVKIRDLANGAMVAHDASKAPFAKNLIFTENTVKLPPTEGLWFTASGLGDFKFYICDLQTGQVAWTGLAREHEKPVLLSVRLKVVNRRITEAESIVVRDVKETVLGNLKAPPPTFAETLAPSERMSRREMLRMPDIYFEALDKLNDSAIPWDKDAYRIENGMVTCGNIPNACSPAAGNACKPLLQDPRWHYSSHAEDHS